jgi:N-acetylglucosaminyldiphosphoundecaprenol N-acetyl-beta-D-mannosaminyltransferase
MPRYNLLNIPIDIYEQNELIEKIIKLSESNKPSRIILIDTYMLLKAKFRKDIYNLIVTADLVLPISAGIKFGLNFLNKKIDKVYNFYNFLISLLLAFSEKNKFIYVLGGKKKYIGKVDKNLRDSFPGIRIVGTYHSQYKKSFEENLITAIRKASPSLILVGDKSPKQDKWIFKMKNRFDQGVFIGVGEFINIVGGKGNSPSDRSVQSGSHSIKKFARNPLKFYRAFIYLFFIPMLIAEKIFNNKRY